MGRLFGRGADQVDGGRITRSMTWMTPFDVSILGVTTLASLIITLPFRGDLHHCTIDGLGFAQLRHFFSHHRARHHVIGEDRRTLSLFSGFSSSSTVPAGSFAKAASVGANTVNGPEPLRVVTRPAASSAAASVLNWPASAAVSKCLDCWRARTCCRSQGPARP